ncbi:MAG: hypothetical protein HUJ24_02330 [Rhodobacteraceae bacterium]|nr:hypothetical protein [Paracoccaceae bacterium]
MTGTTDQVRSSGVPAVSFGMPLAVSVVAALVAGIAAWWLGAGLLLAFATYVGTGIVVLVGTMALKIRAHLRA